MKRVLLDTHAYLWFLFDDPRLSSSASQLIADPQVEKWVSLASLWEITIKAQLGKLELGMPLADFFRQFVDQRDLELAAIEVPHLVAYSRLPLHHRDPFDRLLVAQAQTLGVPIVTADPRFSPYDVLLFW